MPKLGLRDRLQVDARPLPPQLQGDPPQVLEEDDGHRVPPLRQGRLHPPLGASVQPVVVDQLLVSEIKGAAVVGPKMERVQPVLGRQQKARQYESDILRAGKIRNRDPRNESLLYRFESGKIRQGRARDFVVATLQAGSKLGSGTSRE
jgi:hypothetical protein